MIDNRLLVKAHCCRDWPVDLATPIGPCGYCGEKPEIVGPWDDTQLFEESSGGLK